MDVNFNPNSKKISDKEVSQDITPKKPEGAEVVEKDITEGLKGQDALGRASFNILSKSSQNVEPKKDEIYTNQEIIQTKELFREKIEEIANGNYKDYVIDSLIDNCENTSTQKCIIEGIDKGLFGRSKGFDKRLLPALQGFIKIYDEHPDFAKELIEKDFPVSANAPRLERAYEFFNGSADGRFSPLVDKQREFAFEMAKEITAKTNGGCAIFTDSPMLLNENLSELSPEYYDIVREFYSEFDFTNSPTELTSELLSEQKRNPENLQKLKQLLEKEPNKVSKVCKDFGKLVDNVDLLSVSVKHLVDIDTVKDINQTYPKVSEKLYEQLDNFREEETQKGKFVGIFRLAQTKIDDQHIRLTGNEIKKDTDPLTVKFDTKTGKMVSYIDARGCVYNLETGTVAKTDTYEVSGKKVVHKLINGDVTKEILKEHSKIPGEYDIYDRKPDGRYYKVGMAEFDHEGGRHVEKHLTSLNKTTTDYVYADDKTGNKFLYYKVADKNGVVLYENSRSHKVIDDTHFISRVNDDKYDIKFSKEKVVITKLDKNDEKTDEKVEYQIKDFTGAPDENIAEILENITEEEAKKKNMSPEEYEDLLEKNDKEKYRLIDIAVKKYTGGDRVIDRKLVPLLKQLSGDEWFTMDLCGTKFIGAGYTDKNNACSFGSAIFLNDVFENNLAVLEHEIGHQKYHSFDYENDEEFIKIYEKEKKLFTETFPDADIKFIQYFFRGNEPGNQRGRNELCAEVNLITNTFQSWDKIEDRTIEAQTYMPETMAYVANKNRTAQKRGMKG